MRSMYRMLPVLIASCLSIIGGCGGPKFHLADVIHLTERTDVNIVLAVSDTVFSKSTIRQYSMWPGKHWPLNVSWDSTGPQLLLWVHNAGPDAMFPLDVFPPNVDLNDESGDSPLNLEITVEGKPMERWPGGKTIMGVQSEREISLPCDDYSRTLRPLRQGESASLRWSIPLLNLVPAASLVPGEYEVAATLRSRCEEDSNETLWHGKAASNRIRFRIDP